MHAQEKWTQRRQRRTSLLYGWWADRACSWAWWALDLSSSVGAPDWKYTAGEMVVMKQEERETGLSVRKICRKIKQKRNGRRQWAASGRRGNGRERERETNNDTVTAHGCLAPPRDHVQKKGREAEDKQVRETRIRYVAGQSPATKGKWCRHQRNEGGEDENINNHRQQKQTKVWFA